MCRQSEKNLLNSNISSRCLHNMANFCSLTAEISWRVWGTPANFNRFASSLRYCSDVAHRKPTKLCTMFGRLLGWYAIYTFSGALAPWRNFARCKIQLTSKPCVVVYRQRYCTALQQRALAKLCGVVQWMELQNFCRGRHLYSAGRPSHWALAHISSWNLFWLKESVLYCRPWNTVM